MARFSLEDNDKIYEEDWADKIEPYTSAIALGADAIGLGTSFASGGILSPIGASLAILGNIPNIIVDGYQTVRDWKRTIKNGAPIKNAIWNSAETALNLFGAKMALKGVKYVSDKSFAKEVKGLIKDEVKRREGKRYILRKRGMSDEDITKYITLKATNTVMNSKNIITKKRENNKKSNVVGRRIGYTVNSPIDIYNSKDLITPQDNTRTSIKNIWK